MASKSCLFTEEEVRKLYVEDGLTIEQAARATYCDKSTFARYMKLYGIKGRNPSDRHRHRLGKAILECNKEDLEAMYNDQLMSLTEIAEVYNTSDATIYHVFKRLGIKTRTPAQSYGLRMKAGKVKKGRTGWKTWR